MIMFAHEQPLVTASGRHRLEVRVTPQQDALIRQTAGLQNTTVTALVLDTATTKAKGVIKRHQDQAVSNEAFDRFSAELDRPAELTGPRSSVNPL